jgi:hypothetical protein
MEKEVAFNIDCSRRLIVGDKCPSPTQYFFYLRIVFFCYCVEEGQIKNYWGERGVCTLKTVSNQLSPSFKPNTFAN